MALPSDRGSTERGGRPPPFRRPAAAPAWPAQRPTIPPAQRAAHELGGEVLTRRCSEGIGG
jgi:hypothetical protein